MYLTAVISDAPRARHYALGPFCHHIVRCSPEGGGGDLPECVGFDYWSLVLALRRFCVEGLGRLSRDPSALR